MNRRVKCSTIAVAGVLLMAGMSWAGRPMAIDDADPVDVKQFEFEAGAGYEYENNADCKHWDFPFGLACGVVPGLEVGVGFGSQFEERNEIIAESGAEDCVREERIGDLVIGAKWLFVSESLWCPRQSLVPSVKFPTADDRNGLGSGETDYDITWIASKSFGEKAGAHINVGYSWIGEPEDEDVSDVVHYGLALDYQIIESLQLVCEVFAENELLKGSDTIVQYNTGFRWGPAEGLTLDIAGGSKLSSDGPDLIATAGLTWAFGFNNTK